MTCRSSAPCGMGPFKTKVPLRYIEYGVYGDLVRTYPKPTFYLFKGDYSTLLTLEGREQGRGSASNKNSCSGFRSGACVGLNALC